MYNVEKAIEKWRKVLDAATPVVDEGNAAVFLDAVHQYFKIHEELDSRAPTIFIPTFRMLLSSFKLHHNPILTNDNPIVQPWIKEYDEETLRTMYVVDLDSEFTNEMRVQIEEAMLEVGHELYVNFRINDNEVKIYIEPYDNEDTYVPHGLKGVLNDSEWWKVGEE